MCLSDAINEMRRRRQAALPFGILFVTQKGELRKIERCQLRAAPRSSGSSSHKLTSSPDAFLFLTDLETGEPKQCRKRLVRQVRFDDDWQPLEF